MTNRSKIIFIVAVLAGVVAVCILVTNLFSSHKAAPVKPSSSIPSSESVTSAQSAASKKRFSFFTPVSGDATSSGTSVDAQSLEKDAEYFLHLRYDQADTSVSVEQLKERLRGYVAEEALAGVFAGGTGLPTPSSQTPSTSTAPASGVSAPAASFAPVQKMHAYITVNRVYTYPLKDGRQNVLACFTLTVGGGSIQENSSEHMLSYNMEYSPDAGRWIVDGLETDQPLSIKLPPLEKEAAME